MEFKKNKTKPDSTREMLRQQVEEQSPLCDFTVVHGCWSKRFHSCVLVGSPFFRCLLEQDFQEKHKGSVDLHIGTAATIEASLMFLYGKCPTVNMSNVSHFLDIAEFFMIPNLKSLCVKYIEACSIQEDNFKTILHMSSMYDFEVQKCDKYIMQHMDEILSSDEVLQFTNETIQSLFSDKMLSYVLMDTKFKYLMKWTKHDIRKRHPSFQKLIGLLKLTEVTRELLNEAKSDEDIGEFVTSLVFEESVVLQKYVKVLVSKSQARKGFWAYDIEGASWYRIERTGTCEGYNNYESLCGGKGCNDPVVYFKGSGYSGRGSVFIHDLEADVIKKTTLVSEGADVKYLETVSGYCYAINEKSIPFQSDDVQSVDLESEEGIRRLQLACMLQGGIAFNQMLLLSGLCSSRPVRKVTTLYTAHINPEGNDTIMTPIVSLRGRVNNVCANSTGLVAMTPLSGNSIVLFDSRNFHLDTKDLPESCSNYPTATENGFVFLKNQRAVYIVPVYGPSPNEKYHLQEICLDDQSLENSRQYEYYSVEKWLIRYYKSYNYRDKEKKTTVQEYVLHDQVLSEKSISTVQWTKMPLPRDDRNDAEIFKSMTTISLPRSMLRCHIECPHCERVREERETSKYNSRHRERSPVVDWDTADDDSDDYYAYGHYDYYDDYYYSSD